MTTVDTSRIGTAVATMLTAVTLDAFGDADAPVPPTPVAGAPLRPWGFVDVAPGAYRDGDVGDPSSLGEVVVQLTCVGRSSQQANWLMARAHDALLAVSSSGGWANEVNILPSRVIGRFFDSSAGTDREGDVVNVTELYRLVVSG